MAERARGSVAIMPAVRCSERKLTAGMAIQIYVITGTVIC
jgi:hypothetical protein